MYSVETSGETDCEARMATFFEHLDIPHGQSHLRGDAHALWRDWMLHASMSSQDLDVVFLNAVYSDGLIRMLQQRPRSFSMLCTLTV